MGNILAILDEEEEYVSRLLRYLNGRPGNEFEVAAFTSEESFRQYSKKHAVGLLVCEETLYASMEEGMECPAVLLSARRSLREGAGPPTVYKFQSAQEIFDAIVGYYREMMPEAQKQGTKDTKIVTVCSAVGGNGVSTLAYTLAKRKAKGEKILFVSLDPFFQTERTEDRVSETLTEAIYFIRQNSAKFSEKLKLKTVERMDCLYGVSHWEDLCEIGRKEMAEPLAQLVKRERYGLVVVDAGAFTTASAGCMEISDLVVFLPGEGRKAAGKEQEFMRQAKCADGAFEKRLFCVPRQLPERMLEEVLQRIG